MRELKTTSTLLITLASLISLALGKSILGPAGNANQKGKADHDVLIIGAGMAGLSALVHLVKNNVTNVAVLEAKDVIGGRIQAYETPYGSLDMGAQWIHGPSPINSVFNLANSYGLIKEMKCDSNPLRSFIMDNGRLVEQELITKLEEDIASLKSHVDNLSLEESLNSQFKELLEKYPKEIHEVAAQHFNSYKIAMLFDNGYELDQVGSDPLYFTTGCDLDTNGSNYQMITRLAEEGGQERILRNSEVVEINNSEGEYIAVKVKRNGQVQRYTADHVVWTPSIGVFKAVAHSLFKPQLSSEKLKALEKFNFGRGVKIFMLYSKPFWSAGNWGVLDLGTSNEDYIGGKTNWTKRAAHIRELYDNPNTLMTVVFGDSAYQVEALEAEKVGRLLTAKIRRYTGDPSIPYPDQVIKSNWISDPFVRGTYSSSNSQVTKETYETLARPEMNGRLLFAGEATSVSFHSTMHGARSSGLREAERILGRLTSQHA